MQYEMQPMSAGAIRKLSNHETSQKANPFAAAEHVINCHYRFTTYERVERPQIIVIKNNGTRELFNRDKLLQACIGHVKRHQ
jgi:transcriptional regulator NrdR family protein